ncbi:unnamed protein product, partial [Prorocentrum cordatum]
SRGPSVLPTPLKRLHSVSKLGSSRFWLSIWHLGQDLFYDPEAAQRRPVGAKHPAQHCSMATPGTAGMPSFAGDGLPLVSEQRPRPALAWAEASGVAPAPRQPSTPGMTCGRPCGVGRGGAVPGPGGLGPEQIRRPRAFQPPPSSAPATLEDLPYMRRGPTCGSPSLAWAAARHAGSWLVPSRRPSCCREWSWPAAGQLATSRATPSPPPSSPRSPRCLGSTGPVRWPVRLSGPPAPCLGTILSAAIRADDMRTARVICRVLARAFPAGRPSSTSPVLPGPQPVRPRASWAHAPQRGGAWPGLPPPRHEVACRRGGEGAWPLAAAASFFLSGADGARRRQDTATSDTASCQGASYPNRGFGEAVGARWRMARGARPNCTLAGIWRCDCIAGLI